MFKKQINSHVPAALSQVIPTFYQNFRKTVFFLRKHVWKKYCEYDDKKCCPHNTTKQDAFKFNNQQLDCLYALFRYRIRSKKVAKSEQLFDNVQRAVHVNLQNRSGQNAQHREKGPLEEKYEKHLLSSVRKTKSTQTSRSAIAGRIEQVEKTKFDIEPIQFENCFLDGQDSYINILVSFKIKTL